MKDGTSQRQALAHPLRVLPDPSSELGVESHATDSTGERSVGPDSVQPGKEAEHLHAVEFVIKQRSVRNVADAGHSCFGLQAKDANGSFRRRAEAGNHAQKCGFAGAVLAAQHIKPPRLKLQRDASHRGGAAVNLRDAISLDWRSVRVQEATS